MNLNRKERFWFELGMGAVGVFLGIALFCLTVIVTARAEESTVYVICSPDSEVLLREGPGRKKAVCGAVRCGEEVRTDWQEKNGYLHLIDMANETGEGWIFAAYICAQEPEAVDGAMRIRSRGRVACRKYPGGKRVRWLKSGQDVLVYRIADGWAVTARGWIRAEYLERDGE